MNPRYRFSQAQLAALIAYLNDKPCALCKIAYRLHRAANHLFYETDEDISIQRAASKNEGK
jgi:hypothetical protein